MLEKLRQRNEWKKDPVFTMTDDELSWLCTAAEFIQVALFLGNSVWKTQAGNGFHFAGGTTNFTMRYLANKLGAQWWRPDWEQRVLR
jgi:hypothetical protein